MSAKEDQGDKNGSHERLLSELRRPKHRRMQTVKVRFMRFQMRMRILLEN